MEQVKPMRCLLEVSALPYHVYRLPDDGIRWATRCQHRMIIARELATHANADGSGIWPSVETMCRRTGFHERYVRYLLNDLERLGFLINGKQRGRKGSRIRALDMAAIRRAAETLHPSENKPVNEPEETRQGNDKPGNEGAETLQRNGVNPAMKGPNPAMSKGQATALPTDHPTALPTRPESGDGRKVGISVETLESWKRGLPEALRTAPWFKQKQSAKEFLAANGEAMATAKAKAWCAGRNTEGMNQVWLFFLNEADNFEQKALESTPEGQAEAQRREDEMVERAFQAGRKVLGYEKVAEAEEESQEEFTERMRNLK